MQKFFKFSAIDRHVIGTLLKKLNIMKRSGHRSYFRNACPRYVLIVFFNQVMHKIFET